MGEALVGLNRLLHKIMSVLADVSLAGIVLVIAVLVVDRCVLNEGPAWAAGAPDLLVTLLAFLFFAWLLRDYIQVGVRLGCDWFPHNARARALLVFAIDALALACGAFLLALGACRLADGGGSWGVWRSLAAAMGGGVMAFDSLLFLAGVLSHEDAYRFRHSKS